jgi:hypothetical protein
VEYWKLVLGSTLAKSSLGARTGSRHGSDSNESAAGSLSLHPQTLTQTGDTLVNCQSQVDVNGPKPFLVVEEQPHDDTRVSLFGYGSGHHSVYQNIR